LSYNELLSHLWSFEKHFIHPLFFTNSLIQFLDPRSQLSPFWGSRVSFVRCCQSLCIICLPLLGSYSSTRIPLHFGASGCATTLTLLSTHVVADIDAMVRPKSFILRSFQWAWCTWNCSNHSGCNCSPWMSDMWLCEGQWQRRCWWWCSGHSRSVCWGHARALVGIMERIRTFSVGSFLVECHRGELPKQASHKLKKAPRPSFSKKLVIYNFYIKQLFIL